MIHFKNILAGIGLVATTAVCVQAVQQDDDTQRIDPEIKKTDKLVNDYNVYAIPLPETLDFAGEPVPLDNPDIRERLDRELLVNTYWQSNGLLLIKRAAKYFPIIEPILEEEGLPDDFKYLAVIESGLTQAVSPARATGFWQILRSTGRELGLEVNDNVDERYNIELSTRAACKYLKNSKENLGSWTLAAAGYNAGNAGMSRRLDQQNVNGYYDLLLGEETGRYVFRILALKQILADPERYGFNFKKEHLYEEVPSYKVKVDTVVTDFVQFAEHFGINYKILKLHNPWLREDHLNNASRKEYQIEIPKEGYYDANIGQ
ncbi:MULTISPECIES: lytic transglycosylase domain-containing protein [Leeuwenhoekiella]|uniref:Putative membrane-bound lytic murein transglycosylase n=2 Tax=Leeuwenhoekiella TaxID=283735 RepID=A3XMM2_LEEBM|nr:MULTISPECIES: lytic transglycosylase domain-containing protein [Leeuwenhoekiella]EAQ49202.1 putative membrane-bound lytic murein transglycosylase [Leeuwenhoekiella blandensis MED217]MAO45398.1 murein transglycosylase [Leeuwenhoekiella sp.]|tara:strand:+ start:10102 stop:11055 length:954 start_codon:yes stop_codon:yes gene_type:complete